MKSGGASRLRLRNTQSLRCPLACRFRMRKQVGARCRWVPVPGHPVADARSAALAAVVQTFLSYTVVLVWTIAAGGGLSWREFLWALTLFLCS